MAALRAGSWLGGEPAGRCSIQIRFSSSVRRSRKHGSGGYRRPSSETVHSLWRDTIRVINRSVSVRGPVWGPLAPASHTNTTWPRCAAACRSAETGHVVPVLLGAVSAVEWAIAGAVAAPTTGPIGAVRCWHSCPGQRLEVIVDDGSSSGSRCASSTTVVARAVAFGEEHELHGRHDNHAERRFGALAIANRKEIVRNIRCRA